MNRHLSPRSVERIMLAASRVQTTTHREAAIIGGAVNSLLRTQKFDLRYIQHAAHASMLWAQHEGWCTPGLLTDPSKPTDEEVRTMVAKLRAEYDPDTGKAAR